MRGYPIAKDFFETTAFNTTRGKTLLKAPRPLWQTNYCDKQIKHIIFTTLSGNYCDKQIKQMIFIRSDCVGYLRITTYFTFYYQIIWIEILRYPSNTNHKKNSWNLQLTLKRKLVKTACYDTHIFIVSHRKHIFSITAHACFVRTKSCFLVFIIN